MRNFKIIIILITLFLIVNCDSILNSKNKDDKQDEQDYIITPGDGEGDNWFLVKGLESQEIQGVPAVICEDGHIYLPIHSHIPSFNNKVVKGIFVSDTNYYLEQEDTIFRVTEQVRDTSLGFYGE